MSYHHFMEPCNDRDDGTHAGCRTCMGTGRAARGSFETFYRDEKEARYAAQHDLVGTEPGWYWWACFPGCLPDGDPTGPFKTEQEAIDDANDE